MSEGNATPGSAVVLQSDAKLPVCSACLACCARPSFICRDSHVRIANTSAVRLEGESQLTRRNLVSEDPRYGFRLKPLLRVVMHTAFDFEKGDFRVRRNDEPVDRDVLLDWDVRDRLGVLIDRP